jgi:U4/U6 small nuclear ribonucleoprotein PRP3
LITEAFTIVIVEGTAKAVRRYDKLMMRRIDWNAKLNDGDDEMDDSKKNKCTRVWKGTSTAHVLRRFCFETFRSEAAARLYLAEVKLDHLYDAAYAAIACAEDSE